MQVARGQIGVASREAAAVGFAGTTGSQVTDGCRQVRRFVQAVTARRTGLLGRHGPSRSGPWAGRAPGLARGVCRRLEYSLVESAAPIGRRGFRGSGDDVRCYEGADELGYQHQLQHRLSAR